MRRLPPGWNETKQHPNGWGWAARLVEFADLPAVAEIIRFDLPMGHAVNDTARRQVLPLFRCPSDHSPDLFWLEEGSDEHPLGAPLFELASANYMGMFGVQDPDKVLPEIGNGVFIGNRAFRVDDLRRGASNTLLVGERTAWLLPSTWVGMDLRDDEGPGRIVGCAVKPPNHPEADECEFSSRHTGGAQFLYGDGRVELISEQVSEVVYQRLAGRH
jgi:prepilin-type processing-associated H-X9-DG protein